MIPRRVIHPAEPVEIVVDVQQVPTPYGVEEAVITRTAAPAGAPVWLTLVTCIFLHGGWMHFLGNMWFLHIFGDNVEDRFGHWGYFLFYVACGAAASLVHLISGPSSTIPTIGASGAIAGVMGAYFLWYPRALIKAAVPVLVFVQIMVLPAALFLGVWFAIQFFQGAASVLSTQAGGVAWWAHVGGFAAGYAAAALLGGTSLVRPANDRRRPEASHVGGYRLPLHAPRSSAWRP
jgi:hypothetical protein